MIGVFLWVVLRFGKMHESTLGLTSCLRDRRHVRPVGQWSCRAYYIVGYTNIIIIVKMICSESCLVVGGSEQTGLDFSAYLLVVWLAICHSTHVAGHSNSVIAMPTKFPLNQEDAMGSGRILD